MDFLSIAMSEIGSISERRIFQLLSGNRGLPLFLVNDPGLNSGLMIPQYAAAALASENKQLSSPASVDSIPSSNNQEDHVSMGAGAATKCLRIINNVEGILAAELMTAVQALEFKRPLRSSQQLENIVAAFREKVAFNKADRLMHTDIKNAIAFIADPPSKFLVDLNSSI
jgi:histidine ammonia-lyase